uniref:HIG1 domain-containing protein n=1 Tax=Heterorhabditis bacteriophora TaxID=37862 RepID=A0A1I7WZ89_HETBA
MPESEEVPCFLEKPEGPSCICTRTPDMVNKNNLLSYKTWIPLKIMVPIGFVIIGTVMPEYSKTYSQYILFLK